MVTIAYPVIDLAATGRNILRLRLERQLSVRDLQVYFGFEQPQAIYKWQSGRSLPSVDNLLALSVLLGVPMEQILVYQANKNAQQGIPCCASHFMGIVRTGWFLPDRNLTVGEGLDPPVWQNRPPWAVLPPQKSFAEGLFAHRGQIILSGGASPSPTVQD